MAETSDLTVLSQWLSQNTEITLAIVFGSLAKNTLTKQSDIDLAILTRQPLTIYKKKYLIESLAGLLGRPVDLVDLQTAGEPLLGQILKYGKLIKGENEQLTSLALKHLYANEDFMPYVNRALKERREKWIK